MTASKKIKKEDWQELLDKDNPFFDYEFLKALEDGQCLNAQTGWEPQYIVFFENNTIVAAIPFYIKHQ